MASQEQLDKSKLAMSQVIADKLEKDPELWTIPMENLKRWMKLWGEPVAPPHLEWLTLLQERSKEEILQILRSPDQKANQLRQSSPFSGILTEKERIEIITPYIKERL
ncbi:hypothetical protein COB57_03320 [Candidatus Peregrinibacteria bacterium]|nr:MAG: hypothetical protein COB57_03320 [Candidatus Peregrinibacteria bacterium]